jgi:hypothetical protein
VLGVLVLAFLYVPAFSTAVTDLWNSLTLSSIPGVTGGGSHGNVQFIETIQDAILGTTVDPTADTYTLYYSMPTGVTSGVALTAAGHTISAPASGEVWLAINGGSDYLFCEDLFLSANQQWVKSGTGFWADFADDNTPDYVVAIDTSKAGVNGQAQTPVINLVIPELHEDTGVALDSPADKTGTGATEVVVPVTWVLDGITANDGVYITRMWITINNTIASAKTIPEEMTLSGGWIGGGGRNSWSAPVKQVEGSTSYFYYVTGDPTYREYPNGERYWYKTGESEDCFMTVNFRCILGADGYDTTAILYYEICDGAGTIVQDSDTIAIQN